MLVGFAVSAAIFAGAAAGIFGAHSLLAAWPFDAPSIHAGWTADPALPAGNPITAALARAAHARRQPAALPATVARLWLSGHDADGRALNGASRYVLHFAAAALPPSGSWWTIAALSDADASADGGRPALAGTAPDLRRNADGSLDIAVQATAPDDPTANWLAAPSGPFRLILRVYAPLPGETWRPPAVDRRESAA